MGVLKLRRLQKIAYEHLFTLKSSNRKLDTFSADRVMNSLIHVKQATGRHLSAGSRSNLPLGEQSHDATPISRDMDGWLL